MYTLIIEVSEMSSYQYLKLLVNEYKDNLEVQSEM